MACRQATRIGINPPRSKMRKMTAAEQAILSARQQALVRQADGMEFAAKS